MNHDVITMFGNDNVHWYGIVIDNRSGQRKVSKIFASNQNYGYIESYMIKRLNLNVAQQPIPKKMSLPLVA